MDELACGDAVEAAAEAALGLLPSGEMARLSSHVSRCESCRQELESMSVLARRLPSLVPGTEPPLGFERRVLARVGVAGATVHRPRRLRALLAAAAVIAVAGGSLGWEAAQGGSERPAALTAAFRESGHNVGQLELYPGNPSWWLSVEVRGASAQGMVTCELLSKDGSIHKMGSFDLVKGNGSWGVPDPDGASDVAAALLVQGNGQVLATARFS